MANLTIKGIPGELVETLRRLARAHHRSLNQEVINRLRLGVLDPDEGISDDLLAEIRVNRDAMAREGYALGPDEAVEIIRREREGH